MPPWASSQQHTGFPGWIDIGIKGKSECCHNQCKVKEAQEKKCAEIQEEVMKRLSRSVTERD